MTNPQQLLAQAHRLLSIGQFAEAESVLRQLIPFDPRNAELLNYIGLICFRQQKLNEAEKFIRDAIAINSSSSQYQLNLGEVLRAAGRVDDAIASQRRAMELDPQNAAAHYNMGVALRQLNRLDEAIAAYQQAVRLKPDDVRACNNLASSLRAQGRIGEAIEWFRKCLQIAPAPENHSNLLYAMWFDPNCSITEIVQEHARWAQRWAAPLQHEIKPHANDRNPDRPIKLGYLSPDLRGHVIGLFMLPILRHGDRTNFETFCYADVPQPDEFTARLRGESDVWVPTTGMTDAALADRIRTDRIDILVDLTAHMNRNRALVFARKPAPVQVSYLAYAGTTGLPTMDYRFSDPHLDPGGVETFGTEEVVRLPETYWCYELPIQVPDVTPLPALMKGRITFACYNSCAKINAPVIELWSKILSRVEGSHIRLAVGGGESGNAHLKSAFAKGGIAPQRIELLDITSYEKYFDYFADADIALDPFPYNGGTTTLDALWMGLPVVTLAGASGMSRAGVSILNNVGFPQFIGATTDDYARIAASLASDLNRLAQLRAALRSNLQSSVLTDAPRFVRNLENAYRQMWRRYCA